MAASFPAALKTFSDIVDGTDFMKATQMNQVYDEVEAIEAFIGPTGGGAQSYSTSVTDMLMEYRRGCSVEYKGAADLYVRSGEIMVYDVSGNRRLKRNPSDTTVDWGDIDTGAEGDNTYYVYAVADASATTFTVVLSLSDTTPSGCTFYRRLGSFINSTDIVKGSFVNDNINAESSVKGWINFNGTGTIAIRDSYNVASITDRGTGAYTVVWDTDFADVNYSAVISSNSLHPAFGASPAATDIEMNTYNTSHAVADTSHVYLMAIGDQ